jgi:hypothetical protein
MAAEPTSPTVVPSDDELLLQLAAVLRSAPGPVLRPRLSALVERVCRTHCPAEAVAARAVRLETALAAYLHERHVLRFRQVAPAELDRWAHGAPLVFVRAAVAACARCRRGPAQAPMAAGQELARVITAERFGTPDELARELTGHPRPMVAGERVLPVDGTRVVTTDERVPGQPVPFHGRRS